MSLWTPVDLSMAAWYDASDAGSITETFGDVDQWDDLSGNDRHATSTGSSRPSLAEEAVNTLNALSFGGAQYFNIASGLGVGSDSTMFGVFTRDAAGDISILLTNASVSSSARRFPLWWDTTNKIYSRYGTVLKQLTTSKTDTGLFVATAQRDSTYESVRLNGLSQGGTTNSSTDNAFDTIGRGGNNNSYQHSGYICEILFFNTSITTENKEKIEGYLAWKWGVTLDSEHPYYSEPPTVPMTVSYSVFTPTKQESYLMAALLGL